MGILDKAKKGLNEIKTMLSQGKLQKEYLSAKEDLKKYKILLDQQTKLVDDMSFAYVMKNSPKYKDKAPSTEELYAAQESLDLLYTKTREAMNKYFESQMKYQTQSGDIPLQTDVIYSLNFAARRSITNYEHQLREIPIQIKALEQAKANPSTSEIDKLKIDLKLTDLKVKLEHLPLNIALLNEHQAQYNKSLGVQQENTNQQSGHVSNNQQNDNIENSTFDKVLDARNKLHGIQKQYGDRFTAKEVNHAAKERERLREQASLNQENSVLDVINKEDTEEQTKTISHEVTHSTSPANMENNAPLVEAVGAAKKVDNAPFVEEIGAEKKVDNSPFIEKIGAEITVDNSPFVEPISNETPAEKVETSPVVEPAQKPKSKLSEYLQAFARNYKEYYKKENWVHSTKSRHDEQTMKNQRKLNANMKKYLSNSLNSERNAQGKDSILIEKLESNITKQDIEDLAQNDNAVLNLFQIAANGVWENKGHKIRLSHSQRVVLADVLVNVSEKRMDKESSKTNAAENAQNLTNQDELEGADLNNG